MAKEVINVKGKDVLVREDTAKAFRGVKWMVITLAAFILIMLFLLFSGIIELTSEKQPTPPPDTAPERSVP